MSLTYTFYILTGGCFISAVAGLKHESHPSTSQIPPSFPMSAHSFRVFCSPLSSQNGISQEQTVRLQITVYSLQFI